MSEKRFEYGETDLFEWIEENGEIISTKECVKKLNEQQATIDKLDQENADLLGARIKAQEEWEKCTDKLKAKILEQQATISRLGEENEQLKKRNKFLEEFDGQAKIVANLKEENEKLEQKIKDKNTYQRVLEAKIRRLKDRIKVLEK